MNPDDPRYSDPDYDRDGSLIGEEAIEQEYDPYDDERFGHREDAE